MNIDLEKLGSLIQQMLYVNAPYLSGNMSNYLYNAQVEKVGANEITISIKAPFYDLKEWKKHGIIKHTGQSFGGITNYAMWVNEYGGFGTHNKSEHWVNRTLAEVCEAYGNEIGAEVINELEL